MGTREELYAMIGDHVWTDDIMRFFENQLAAKDEEISHLQKSFNHTAVLLQESEAEISLLREVLIKIFMRTDNEEILKIIHKVREAK